MQPRGGAGAQISFIFFIDIIMSVSGVMLFLVMLLVLDLSTAIISGPAAGPTRPTRQNVLAETEELHKTSEALDAQINSARERSHRLSGGDGNGMTVSESIVKLKASIARLAVNTEAGDDAHKRIEREMALRFREIQKLRQEIRDIAAAKRKLESAPPKILFSLPEDDSPKNIVVVELSADALIVQPLRSETRPVVVRVRASAERTVELTKALHNYPAADHDVLFTVKPSAFKDCIELIESCQKLGYRTGYEPIEEERSAIGWSGQ